VSLFLFFTDLFLWIGYLVFAFYCVRDGSPYQAIYTAFIAGFFFGAMLLRVVKAFGQADQHPTDVRQVPIPSAQSSEPQSVDAENERSKSS
jgi:hypothetical protein